MIRSFQVGPDAYVAAFYNCARNQTFQIPVQRTQGIGGVEGDEFDDEVQPGSFKPERLNRIEWFSAPLGQAEAPDSLTSLIEHFKSKLAQGNGSFELKSTMMELGATVGSGT